MEERFFPMCNCCAGHATAKNIITNLRSGGPEMLPPAHLILLFARFPLLYLFPFPEISLPFLTLEEFLYIRE